MFIKHIFLKYFQSLFTITSARPSCCCLCSDHGSLYYMNNKKNRGREQKEPRALIQMSSPGDRDLTPGLLWVWPTAAAPSPARATTLRSSPSPHCRSTVTPLLLLQQCSRRVRTPATAARVPAPAQALCEKSRIWGMCCDCAGLKTHMTALWSGLHQDRDVINYCVSHI